MKILQALFLITHGWRPVKLDYGWRWRRRDNGDEFNYLRANALRKAKGKS